MIPHLSYDFQINFYFPYIFCGLDLIVIFFNLSITVICNAFLLLSVDYIPLGFLPRNVAKWVSPLWDAGFFAFSGYVCPKEALAAALGENCKKVQLILNVSEVFGRVFYKTPSLLPLYMLLDIYITYVL